MKAVLRSIRISPKKANLVAGTVRGKKVSDALALLKFMPKKGADILYKVVHSAASNATNNFKQTMEDLQVVKILVTKGPTYKRSQPISRGRAHPIRKRTSHITVEVGSILGETKQVEKKAEIQEKKTSAKQAKTEKSPKKTSATKSAKTSKKETSEKK